MKAVKNAAEIAGARAAHIRDGASVVRFLAGSTPRGVRGGLTEIAAVEALEDFRAAGGRPARRVVPDDLGIRARTARSSITG